MIDLSTKFCHVARGFCCGVPEATCWWVESSYKFKFLKVEINKKVFSFTQLTASLVKPLVFPRPAGHNLILEWDIFYPLPSSWYKPTKPTKAAPKPPESTTSAPETVESWDPHSSHPGEIWMPSGGGWSPDSDVIKTLSEGDDAKANRKIWTETEVNFLLERKKIVNFFNFPAARKN